jgi:hypothetical protein
MELEEIGSRLEVQEEDIESIRRKRRRELIIAPVIGFSVTVLSVIAGAFIGRNDPVFDKIRGYPFAGYLAFSMVSYKPNKKLWLTVGLVTFIVSLIGFIAAHEIAQPHEYGMAIEYGVYSI